MSQFIVPFNFGLQTIKLFWGKNKVKFSLSLIKLSAMKTRCAGLHTLFIRRVRWGGLCSSSSRYNRGEKPPVAIDWEAGWVTEPDWMRSRQEKYLHLLGTEPWPSSP
jgi:hypothetical protein